MSRRRRRTRLSTSRAEAARFERERSEDVRAERRLLVAELSIIVLIVAVIGALRTVIA